MHKSLQEILQDRKLVVLGGVGGVGKTTLSAAMAVQAALDGRRVAVLTIDPARRLGAALGFRSLGNRLRFTSSQRLDPLRSRPDGALAAAMLDVKGTFDEMVTKYAPDKVLRDRILTNPIYVELSQALSGTHEYMALERIHQIYESGEFDLLILDTPPASGLSDFLAAPERLRSFLDRDIVRWFFPSERKSWAGYAAKVAGRGVRWALSLLDRLAGGRILEDVATFLSDFQGLFEGLRERTSAVGKLMQDEKTTFVLVTTADSVPFHASEEMAKELKKEKLHLGAVVVNRTLPNESPKFRNPFEEELWNVARPMLQQQEEVCEKISRYFSNVLLLAVPLTEHDPSSLADLARIEFSPVEKR